MSFKDIIGQEIPKKVLKKDLISGRIASSYLFVGSKGVGKKLTALNFAKALNCQNRTDEPCEECRNCRLIEKGNFPDLLLISSGEKGNISIDKIRELKQTVSLRTPFKRVAIIEDSETLTEEAQNAFLKTLEEPPPDTILILTSSNPNYLFQTIISRCKIVKFRNLNKREVESLLKKRGEKNFKLLASLSGGSMERVDNILEPKAREEAIIFAHLSFRKRLSYVKSLKSISLEVLLDSLYVLYGDILSNHFGLEVRNADLDLMDKDLSLVLEGMKVIRHAMVALKYYVIPEHILYYLSYKLPDIG